MTPSRNISPLTLSLVNTMATDPQSPPGLRKFHATRLTELRRLAARQTERRESPFSRYEQALKNTP